MYKLVKNLVPVNPLKATYPMNATRVVVHNTANDASARNEIAYMVSNNNVTSFHYAVDDKEVVQGLPENRNGWHAGDGSSGTGNRQGIGIEICYSLSGGARFNKAEDNAARFVASILKRKKWGLNKVTKHQDYSGKYCPHRTLDQGWSRFLNMVNKYLKEEDGGKDMLTKALINNFYVVAEGRQATDKEVKGWSGRPVGDLVGWYRNSNRFKNLQVRRKADKEACKALADEVKKLSERPTEVEIKELKDKLIDLGEKLEDAEKAATENESGVLGRFFGWLIELFTNRSK